MRVFVTGNHGYVGSAVAPALVAQNYDVTGLDTLLYEGCDFGADRAVIETLKLDVRDVTPDVLRGFDAVVHLAALSNDPLGDLNDEWTYDVNLRGTLSLAEAAKEAGVTRFVFASSCSMYGRSTSSARVSEDAPLVPLTSYATSKVRSEEGLAALADERFSPVFLRYATAYGVSGTRGASSLTRAELDLPYMLHDEANTNRATPASFAASARESVPRRLTSYVHSSFRSPSGSFERAARWTTASNPRKKRGVTSRTSSCSVWIAASSTPKSQPS